LRQVLYNLMGNAIKFSAGRPLRRGQVSIRAEMEEGAETRLVLRIADNGVGIAPETLGQLFSAFTQAEVSTTRRFGGTGLGLAICKRLVTLMKGDIAVQSVLGEGSTFTVTLPLETADEGLPQTRSDLAGLDCIVVNDDHQAEDLCVYLRHAQARVHFVDNLASAVQRVAGLKRAVVIQHTGRDNPSTEALHAAFAAAPDTRHLLIARGRQRRVRMVAANVVTLDGNTPRRSSFLRAVAVAAGLASPEVLFENGAQDLAMGRSSPPTIAEARAQDRLVLIAEDDEVNQKVILRQIELLGYAAEIADNGTEALRLWRAGRYGLLLTDLHMPDMDGYTLATAVRQAEIEQGVARQARMPILALTANALRGEAIRAKAAGMDDYLTKPLELRLLKAALEKWMPEDVASLTMPADLQESPSKGFETEPVDSTVLQRLVGDDPATLRNLLAGYQASARRLAEDLRAARTADDLRRIADIAHKLKSSSRSVGALGLGDLYSALENACRAETRDYLAQGVRDCDAEWSAVDAWISDFLAVPTVLMKPSLT
ncbi:MAG: sensory transduction histidine kinase, partial [Rhizobacter sp.]|nr:sensory transduction histidine kinase [Rhizobacter sp.]